MFVRSTLRVVVSGRSSTLLNGSKTSLSQLKLINLQLLNTQQAKTTTTQSQSIQQIRSFANETSSNDDQVDRKTRRARENLDVHNAKALEAFFEPLDDKGKIRHSGRSWESSELRIKSFSDLQKLWYVLLKERNMLLTAREILKGDAQKAKQLKVVVQRLAKTKRSMARLLTVLTERQKILMPQVGWYRWEEVWRRRGREREDFFTNKHPEVEFPPPSPKFPGWEKAERKKEIQEKQRKQKIENKKNQLPLSAFPTANSTTTTTSTQAEKLD